MSVRLRAYVWSLIALALALGLVSYPTYPVADWRVVGVMAALAVIVSNMSFALPYGASVSIGFPLLLAALLHSGPMAGAVVALMGGFPLNDIETHKPPSLILGNCAQLFISALLAGLVATRLGLNPFHEALPPTEHVSALVAPLAAMACFFALNLFLVSVGISLRTSTSLNRTIAALQPVSYSVSLMILGALGYLMAYLIALHSWVGLVLLAMPFVLTRQVFRVYVELSEAYTSTVRSLVAAIEAKDPYLRGHSERVADYARRLALRIGLGAADVQLAERAALLHDLGKVAAPLSTLKSSNRLSEVELAEIHQ
ncbi:MAG: HD domain-containing phosphohydrolase, partial [Coriobacteriales bacterium]